MKPKNKAAQELGKLGAAKSPRRHAWRDMSADERTANAKAAAAARWGATSEDQRKAQLAKVREGIKLTKGTK